MKPKSRESEVETFQSNVELRSKTRQNNVYTNPNQRENIVEITSN